MSRKVITIVLFAVVLVAACSPSKQTPSIGPTLVYQSTSLRYTFEYPATWQEVTGQDKRCIRGGKCFASSEDQILTIREAHLGNVEGSGLTSMQEYLDMIVPDLGAGNPGFQLLSRSELTTTSGLVAEVLEYTLQNGLVKVKELWFISEGEAIIIGFMTYAANYDQLEPIVEYSFRSLEAKSTE